jgi:hypothetical protein
MSLKDQQAGQLHGLGDAELLGALMELMVSPPALARPRICALLFWACSMKLEKSLALSGS